MTEPLIKGWQKAVRDFWCMHLSHRHASHRSLQERSERRIAEGDWMFWIDRGKGTARCMRCAIAEGHESPVVNQ